MNEPKYRYVRTNDVETYKNVSIQDIINENNSEFFGNNLSEVLANLLGFPRKHIRSTQILKIPVDQQMPIVGDFFVHDDAELVLEGNSELAIHN